MCFTMVRPLRSKSLGQGFRGPCPLLGGSVCSRRAPLPTQNLRDPSSGLSSSFRRRLDGPLPSLPPATSVLPVQGLPDPGRDPTHSHPHHFPSEDFFRTRWDYSSTQDVYRPAVTLHFVPDSSRLDETAFSDVPCRPSLRLHTRLPSGDRLVPSLFPRTRS